MKGALNGEPYELPDGHSPVQTSYHYRLIALANVLSDLDRSPVGRHEGDVESQSSTGVSQGNPILPVGMHIGWTMDGRRIIVPPRSGRGDPDAWVEPRE